MITIANIEFTYVGSVSCVYSTDDIDTDFFSPVFEGMKQLDTSLGPPILVVDPPYNFPSNLRVAKVEFSGLPDEDTNRLLIGFCQDDDRVRWIQEVPIKNGTDLIIIKRVEAIRAEAMKGFGHPETFLPVFLPR